MSAKFRVLGVNDDAADCECCGRQGLKRVMWLQPLDEDGNDIGSPLHFGMTCGAKAAGWGYGSDLGRIERRLRKEEHAARMFYSGKCSERQNVLLADGLVRIADVALRSDGSYRGKIFVLPTDPILSMGAMGQAAEIRAAKSRVRAAYPIFKAGDENWSAAELRALLVEGAA